MAIHNPNIIYVQKDKDLYAIIVRENFNEDGVNFITPDSSTLQVAVSAYESNSEVKPHFHNRIRRTLDETMEVVHIDEGEAEVSFFKESKKILVGSYVIKKGDIVIFFKGIHRLVFRKKTRIIEVKQGPYTGATIDKSQVNVDE